MNFRGAAFLVLMVGFLSRQPKVHASQIIVLYGLIPYPQWLSEAR
jgi:hypothetical protein